MTHIFTVEETLAALKEAVAERGEDYVYEADPLSTSEACSYSTIAGEDSCIVGNVLKRLTPDIFQSIHEHEWYQTDGDTYYLREESIHSSMSSNAGMVEMPFTGSAIDLLRSAQTFQDIGESWGSALGMAAPTSK